MFKASPLLVVESLRPPLLTTRIGTDFPQSNGAHNSKMGFMHKHLQCGEIVDHINNNKLDNRKSNLRDATRSDNSQNRGPITATSGFRGVTRAGTNRFQANIYKDRVKYYLGCFKTPEAAAEAYDGEAKELYSQPALNFPRL